MTESNVVIELLHSIGTVFAKGGPPADNPGNGPQIKGEKQGFSGNVTAVNDGNMTIQTEQGLVTLTAPGWLEYKIPREINKWETGNLSALGNLMGRRVSILAGNVTGTWQILKLMVLPVPGTQPLHAHRTGVVTALTAPSGNSTGNITIIDLHGVYRTFTIGVGNETVYSPKGMGVGNITVGQSFVTVVTTSNPKVVPPPIAEAIVLHAVKPEGWPTPTP
jgi:hypothetical protein